MYEDGLGVPQDYAEAVKWYRKAAEEGGDAASAPFTAYADRFSPKR
jgi:TPR repeat protein